MAKAGQLVNFAKCVVEYTKPRMQVAMRYAMAEMTPPKISDIGAIRAGYGNLMRSAKNGAYKNVTVREAWLNTLVTIEVFCWFFVGECIGKRHLIGYDV